MKSRMGKVFGYTVIRVTLLLIVTAIILFGVNTGVLAFSVLESENFGDIKAMTVQGNYDALNPMGGLNSEPREIVAKSFFDTQPDEYDFLVIFTTFDFQMTQDEAVALYVGVRNDVQGIGVDLFDYSPYYGSEGKLQGVIDMGNIANLETDPTSDGFAFTLGTLSHELMHRWGAFPSVQDADGTISKKLIGVGGAHWSFLLDTRGSLMYGNPWHDNGDGTFTSYEGRRYYSPLDLYLMGMNEKSEVPRMLLINSPETDPSMVSQPGVTISGTAEYVTIEDIVAAEGDRIPDSATSQKDFKVGCILLTRDGSYSASELNAVRNIMNNWVLWHSGLTEGKSTVEFVKHPLESLPYNPGPETPPHTSRPTPAEVLDGVAWLLLQQLEDGSWSDTDQTTVKDTGAAIRALGSFDDAQTAVEDAYLWIDRNDEPFCTDYLARLSEAKILNGITEEQWLDELVQRQNLDGGWGADGHYLSSSTDTALALRAIGTASQYSKIQLDAAVQYLSLSQNMDGGWGAGLQASDIQNTANALIALAPLRTAYELNQTIEYGLGWLAQQQQSDGGFGEGESTVYNTAAALEVFKVYSSEADLYGPAVEFIQSTQSDDGSWYASVYETAVAVESLYLWKDSVDADLVVISDNIQLTPEVISQTPENIGVDIVVNNSGLADAADFTVALYENTVSDASLLAQQTISVSALSATDVHFDITFNDDQDHRLLLVVDSDNVIAEANEGNNTSLIMVYNDLNLDPDLLVTTDNMLFSPAAISQMPADITLEAIVENTGLTDVSEAVAMLYQDAISDTSKIGEKSIVVPAQSSTMVSFSFTIADGDAHRYYLVIDPDDLISERSEFNNTAIRLLTSDPASDFVVLSQDITLSANPAEMGQDVTIGTIIRNYGNRDGYNIPVRYYILQDGQEYDIATRTIDLPAGSQTEHQVVWTADRHGTDLAVYVHVDPLNAVDEVSETNNSASAADALTVNPYPDPNLKISYKDISVSPTPVLQNSTAVISAGITNTGGGVASDIQVNFYLHKPEDAPELLGSTMIAALNPEDNAEASWTIDNVSVSGKWHVTVSVDPDNTITEVFENDNSAFLEVDILSIPDFVVGSELIRFDPAAPAEGDPVTIQVTVQNFGGQDGLNVPVVLYEDAAQIAAGTIAEVPGLSQAQISFVYDTTGKSGVHYFKVAVDPEQTITEQSTDNNTATGVLGIQNADLWLSRDYIAGNGGIEQASTTFFFRLDEAADVQVVVVDADDTVVRTFTSDAFYQTTGTSVTWDGRNDDGTLVPDGEYRIQVLDSLGNVLMQLTVTVDNNLSSLADAAGTDYMAVKNITCLLPELASWRWFSDESGIIFLITALDSDAPEYPPGVYTMSPTGSDIRMITPEAWASDINPDFSYRIRNYTVVLSQDDSSVAVIVSKGQKEGDGLFYELWNVDRYGNNFTLLDTITYRQEDGTYVYESIDVQDLLWSPDGQWLACAVTNRGVRLVRQDASAHVDMPIEPDNDFWNFSWSPDSQRFCYVSYNWDYGQETYVVADTAGNTIGSFQLPEGATARAPQWLDDSYFVFFYNDNQQDEAYAVILDAVSGQTVAAIRAVEGNRISQLAVHPDGDGFLFSSEPDFMPGESYVNYCDKAGLCQNLYQTNGLHYWPGLHDLTWSPLGDKLMFYDDLKEAFEEDIYAGHVVVMDWPSMQTISFPASYPVQPMWYGSFHIWAMTGSMWIEQNVLHFSIEPETRVASLPDLEVDADGHAVIRVVHSDTDQARVDAIALLTDEGTIAPVRATVVDTNEDILDRIVARDGLQADLAGVTVELEWDGVPRTGDMALSMHASEIKDPDSTSGTVTANDPATDAPYPTMSHVVNSLHWMNDGVWAVGADSPDGVYVLNTETADRSYFGLEEWRDPQLSPTNRYLTNSLWVPSDSACYGRGYQDVWSLMSLMNLTADLKVYRTENYLALHGTAADRNFDYYALEYADVQTPDQWYLVSPPSEIQVVDDLFAQWVPPYAGTYLVRLTVSDKAGNTAVVRQRVSWGLNTSIAGLYLQDNYISPNTDSTKNTLVLYYTVREPVHLEFYIYNQENGQKVATLLRDYAAVPADDGRDSITWDGRDEQGRVVPSGEYYIEVAGYRFTFTVDTQPPQTALELSKISVTATYYGLNDPGNDPTEIEAGLGGIANDPNFDRWVIETGEGDNPAEWDAFPSALYQYNSASGTEYDFVHALSPNEIGSAAGRKFRVTAWDYAGNICSAATEVLEEIFIVYQWQHPDYPDVPSGLWWWDLYVNRREDGKFEAPRALLPASFIDSDRHVIKSLITTRSAVTRMVMQYRIGTQWNDGPQAEDALSGLKNIAFAGQLPNTDSINAIRFKAIDVNLQEHLSNPIPIREYFQLSCIHDGDNDNSVTALVYPFKDLTYLACKVRDENGVETLLGEYDADQGLSIPIGEVYFTGAKSILTNGVSVTLEGRDIEGGQYFTEFFPEYICPDNDPNTPGDSHEDENLLAIRYLGSSPCELHSGPISVGTKQEWRKLSELTQLDYYLQKKNQWLPIKSYDLTLEEMGDATIDDFAADDQGAFVYPEGRYPVKAVLEDQEGQTLEIDGTVRIDRTQPFTQMTSPVPGETVCPGIKWHPPGSGIRVGIRIWALMHDNQQEKFSIVNTEIEGSYAIYYSYEEFPEEWEWYQGKFKDDPPEVIIGSPTQSSELGIWDVTDLAQEDVTVRLVVSDGAGNSYCYQTRLHIDRFHPLTAEADKNMLSPGINDASDGITVNYAIGEPVQLNISVLQQTGTQEIDVRKLIDDESFPGGGGQVLWDGKDDAGQLVEDGLYTIRVTVTDACGNAQQVEIDEVEIDRTPPVLNFSYPQAGSALGIIVEILGTATDKNLVWYQLAVYDDTNPDPLQTLTNATLPVENGLLGRWNTYGADGIRILKLSARDLAGNEAETQVVVDLGNRLNLITDLYALPDIFSPNEDGKLETIPVSFILNPDYNEAFNVTLDFVDENENLVRRLTQNSLPGGLHTIDWDGKDGAGAAVDNGVYKARLSAALVVNPATIHKESLTLWLDASAPVVQIDQPLNEAFVPDVLNVQGSITDEHLESYNLTLSWSGGTLSLESGQTNRQDYTFAAIDDLADGPYTLTVDARDRGQIQTRTEITLVVDKTKPEITLEAPEPDSVYGGDATVVEIKAAVEETNIEQWQIRYRPESGAADVWTILSQGSVLPDGGIAYTWPVGAGGSVADGGYILSLYAVDKAGWDKAVTVRVVVDNTAPTVNITDPADSGFVTSATQITGSVEDANLVSYNVEMAEGHCDGASRWNPIYTSDTTVQDGILAPWQALPPDGQYCLQVTARDAAGQTAGAAVNVTVDTTPPDVPELSGQIENSVQAVLTWLAVSQPDVAGYNLYRNSAMVNAALITENRFTDNDLVQGAYTYQVRAVDRAGLESAFSNAVELRVDLSPPVARISSPRDNDTVADLVDVTGTATADGDFKEYRLYVGAGTAPAGWQLIHISAVSIGAGQLGQLDTVTLDSGGQYTLKLEAEDVSGNTAEHQVTVTVDNQAPDAPVLLSALADSQVPNTIDVTWEVQPDVAGYLLYRNDELANFSGNLIGDLAPYMLAGPAYSDSGLADGTFEYYVLAMDAAGNISLPSNRISVDIDLNSPVAAITTPESGFRFDQTFMVRADCTDQDIASVLFQYKTAADTAWIDLDDAVTQSPFITYFNPAVLNAGAALDYGQYDLRAVATDRGGQTDADPQYITVEHADVTPPAAPLNLAALVDGGQITFTWDLNEETDLAGYNLYQVQDSGLTLVNTTLIGDMPFVAGETEALADDKYRFQLKAVDTAGNESLGSAIVPANVFTPVVGQLFSPDQEPQFTLYGYAAPDHTIEVFNDNGSGPATIGTLTADEQGVFFFDGNFTVGENHLFVKSSDELGNVSKPSPDMVVVHGLPPAAPTGLAGAADGYDVTLTWNANDAADSVVGYNLYRDNVKLNVDTWLSGGTATASANNSYASFAADGSPYSAWYADVYPQGDTIWWQLQFTEPKLIRHISLNWYSELYAADTYEIQVWSGFAWIPLFKVMGNAKADNAFDVAPAYATDRIRVVIPPGGSQPENYRIQITEVALLQLDPIRETTYTDQLEAESNTEPGFLDGHHQYYLEAVNSLGMISAPSDVADVPVGDVVPPDAPTDLQAVADASTIQLSWTAPAGEVPAGYNVYRQEDGQWLQVNTGSVEGIIYSDDNVPNGAYVYRVTALDAVGNESEPSNTATAAVSITPPEQPVNLTAQPLDEGNSVLVCWDDTGSAGYLLYRATTAGGPYEPVTQEVITGQCYTDVDLQNGVTYYYMVHAVDAAGNESIDSTEAQAVPEDLIAPDIPMIHTPTIAGRPVDTASQYTDMMGWAEPGVSVTLYRDDMAETTTRSLENDIPVQYDQVFGSDENLEIYNQALSPNGGFVAYYGFDRNSYTGFLKIADLENGSQKTLTGNFEGLAWSPDGDSLAFSMDTNYGYRVHIHDTVSGTKSPVTSSDEDFSEWSPCWSSDGSHLLFISNRTGAEQMVAYAVQTGQVETLAAVSGALFPMLSPDDRYLSYVIYQYPGYRLYLQDLQTGADPVPVSDAVTRDPNTNGPYALWAPNDNQLAFVTDLSGVRDVHVITPDDLSPMAVTSTGDVDNFAWLPGSAHMVYTRTLSDSDRTVWVAATDATQFRQVARMAGSDHGLAASTDGRIGFLSQDSAHLVTLAGGYAFDRIELAPGENLFAVNAVDAAGNESALSEPVIINVSSDLLADIEVLPRDLFIYPYAPVTGDSVRISAVVHNIGFAAAENVTVDFYIWNYDADIEQLAHTATLDRLDAGQDTVVWFDWDSTGSSGPTGLIVEADTRDNVFEPSEVNNFVYKEFYVAPTQGLQMFTQTNFDLYDAFENVLIGVNFYNTESQRDVSLTVEIVDADQHNVDTVAVQAFMLPYTSLSEHAFVWDTGRTPAGDYYVHTVLEDATGRLAENLVPFTILADDEIEATLVTESQHYGAGRDVQVHGVVVNRSSNRIAVDLTTRVVIRNASGDPLHESNGTISYLIQDAPAAVNTSWNTADNLPGSYTAVFTVLEESLEIARAETIFYIDETFNLAGSLSVEPALVSAGTLVSVPYTVIHNGNTPAGGVVLRVSVIDPDTQAQVAADSTVVDLGAVDTATGTSVIDTQGYGGKTYRVQLDATTDSGSRLLAYGSLTVRSAAQLPVELSAILTPDADTVANGEPVTMQYAITNSSTLDVDPLYIELTVPQGVAGDFERTITLPAGTTLYGAFELPTGALVPGAYTSGLAVKLSGTLDATELANAGFTVTAPEARIHPPVALPGGPYIAAVGETILVDGSHSFDLDEGLSDSGEAPFDTIMAWAWETDTTVEPLGFDDGFGPVVELDGFDTPDTYTIALRVTDNTAAAFPSEAWGDLSAVGLAQVSVHVHDIPDLFAGRLSDGVEVSWTPIGADEYEVLRSEIGPNMGFETIAVIDTNDTVYLDADIESEVTCWYRVRCVVNEETRISVAVTISEVQEEDSDGDGVLDGEDACPDTPAGHVVDASGCSAVQLLDEICPCEREPAWLNHGDYMFCVTHMVHYLLKERLITLEEKCAIVSERARSDCGKTKSIGGCN